MRASGETPVASTTMSPIPLAAREPRCTKCQEFGIPWVRRPFDFPLNALGGTVPRLKQWTSSALTLLRRRFHRVLEKHGCRTTDHFAGFQITGRFRAAGLVELMALLPEGSTELMCHPGRCGPALRAARTRLKDSREAELAALVAPEVRQAIERHGIDLLDYRRLTAVLTSAPPAAPRY